MSALRATSSRPSAGRRRPSSQLRQVLSVRSRRSGSGVGCGARLSLPQRSSSTYGPPALDARAGHLLDAVVLDLPGEPRRIERDGIGGAEHPNAVGADAQRDRRAPEVRSRR